MRRALVALGVLGALVLAAPDEARAAESSHGPFYVQGSPLGTTVGLYPGSSITIGSVTFSSGGSLGYYRLDAEFGYHFFGKGDGLVAGIRQVFLVGWGSAGATSGRIGWDIAVPIGDEMELGIGPYAHLGALYPFDGSRAGFFFGFGADVKLYFERRMGLYAFVRPFEFSLLTTDPLVAFLSFAGGLGLSF
jgi:hypothetical protein